MSLTKEQIKNLKPGDPLVIHSTFERMATDGDICVKFPMSLCGFVDNTHLKCAHPSAVSIVNPKYDPCRLFKKGDVVEPKQVKGRVYSKDSKHLISKKCIVFRDEDEPGYVVISHEGKNYSINTAYLELIIPVEELEPYYIEEKDIEFQVRMKYEDKNCLISIFRFKNIIEGYKQYYDMLPPIKQARERAEAECDRLNAEWRKEQNYNQN